MILTTASNIVVSLLCVGVLIQVTRMIFALRTFQKSDIGQTVAALDHATERATAALSALRHVLATEVAANNRSLSTGEALRDELSVMVGVGNNIADRIMEAAAAAAPAGGSGAPDLIEDDEDQADEPDEAGDCKPHLVSAGGN
jgi:hypothetical protein